MTAKQYLRQIKELDGKANKMLIRYHEMCGQDIAAIASIRSPRLDADKVQTSGSGAGFTAQVEKLVDIQAETNRLIDAYIDKRDQIVRQIAQMPEPYCSLLFKRYVEYKSFDDIAVEMIYSYDRTVHIHGEGLVEFSRRFLREGIDEQ